MSPEQQGFTLIEIVIAFAILSMGTILTVNLVTQSSIRADRINRYMTAMDTMESAIALLRGEVANSKIKQSYSGSERNGYQWHAKLEAEVNSGDDPAHIRLYRFNVRVVDRDAGTQLALTTIVADR